QTCSTSFPRVNALQPTYGGSGNFCGDAFVTKLNPTGSALIYSTYIGGQDIDLGLAIAVDNSGNVYVTGHTTSVNFPVANPLQETYGGGNRDRFVTKLNAAGSA